MSEEEKRAWIDTFEKQTRKPVKPFTVENMIKGARVIYPEQRIANGLKMEVKRTIGKGYEVVEIGILRGLEIEKVSVNYKVENNKVKVGRESTS